MPIWIRVVVGVCAAWIVITPGSILMDSIGFDYSDLGEVIVYGIAPPSYICPVISLGDFRFSFCCRKIGEEERDRICANVIDVCYGGAYLPQSGQSSRRGLRSPFL